jgi:DNA-binding transcriptional LysR family regulator
MLVQRAMPLDWNDLRFVIAAGRVGSLGGVARSLGVTRSTVSRRLDAAEEAFGARLFERTVRGLKPTRAGARVLERADDVEVAVAGMEAAARAETAEVEGRVRISAPPTMNSDFVAPTVGALLAAHPRLAVELSDETTVVSLERGDADIALRMMPPERQRLVAQKLGTMRYVLAAAPAYVEARGRPSVDSLAEHVGVAYAPPHDMLPESRFLTEAGPRVALRCWSARAQLLAAASGVGVAVLPEALVRAHGELLALDEVPSLSRDVWIVMHEVARDRPAIRAVYRHLHDAFRRMLR